MKLHKSLLLFGASTLLLTACGGEAGSTDESGAADDAEIEEVAEEDDETVESASEQVPDEEAEEEPADTSNEIVVGEPIEFETFTVTITDFETSTDYDGNPMLVYTYDWVNNGEDTEMPFMTFDITGFQSGVSTESSPFSDSVDYGSGQVEVRPEGVVEGAQGAIGLTSVEEPVELELTETFSFEDNAYTTTINPADYQ